MRRDGARSHWNGRRGRDSFRNGCELGVCGARRHDWRELTNLMTKPNESQGCLSNPFLRSEASRACAMTRHVTDRGGD
jgi:hypothetical protein